MKTSTAIGIVLALFVVVGGTYWYSTTMQRQTGSPSEPTDSNGSPNQDNVDQSDTSASQAPSGEGIGDMSGIGEKSILGINSSASLGQYLTAFNGMTVYTYAKDTAGASTCSGDCAANWSPYTVPSSASIKVPATIKGQVSTIARADGSFQVTYKNMPLYFWKDDAQPDDTTGQGVNDEWFVVKP
ncbi:hypothetical protein H7X87_03450 [Acetobacteraceae bacterium]|nr:hypothetical protein [Candidatus Parcubacteria bacterium]